MKILIYDELVETNFDQFILKVKQISSDLGIDPNWLMAVMYIESKLNPQAVNTQLGDDRLGKTKRELALTRGTGLLQFMPHTLENWGMNGQQIFDMSNVDQLDYVKKYLEDYKGRMAAFVDVYFCVFRPSAVGKYKDFVLGGLGTNLSKKIAKQNSGMDKNDDEQITKDEVTRHIMYAIDEDYKKYLIN